MMTVEIRARPYALSRKLTMISRIAMSLFALLCGAGQLVERGRLAAGKTEIQGISYSGNRVAVPVYYGQVNRNR